MVKARATQTIPHHGDRGNPKAPVPKFPRTLSIAVSRQTGSRGGSIAQLVGRKLGWQVVDQDLLEFMAQQGSAGDDLTAAAREWAERRLRELQQNGTLAADKSETNLARTILTLAAIGEVVMVGRGAGHLLPPASTLHVRIVAPRAERIAYFGQWQRLTPQDAEREVDLRDARRSQYMLDHFSVDASDPVNYDLILNSGTMGEEMCAQMIVDAAKSRMLGEDSGEFNLLNPM
jgi:cytidylate kinase